MTKTVLEKNTCKVPRKLLVRASKKPLKCSFKYGRSLKQHNCLKLQKEFDSFEDFFEKIGDLMEDFINLPTHSSAPGKLNLPDSILSILKKHICWRPKPKENNHLSGLGNYKNVNKKTDVHILFLKHLW
jgi:hypothetical protein